MRRQAIYVYSGSHAHKRTNAAFLLSAWLLLYGGRTPEQVRLSRSLLSSYHTPTSHGTGMFPSSLNPSSTMHPFQERLTGSTVVDNAKMSKNGAGSASTPQECHTNVHGLPPASCPALCHGTI